MRKLFMAIFVPVLMILGTPALVATLMYDGSGMEHLPIELYTDEYDAMEMIYEELNTSITEVQDGTSDDLVFNLSQDVINRAIYEAILEGNPNYNPGPDCANDDECYIFSEAQTVEGYNISFRLIGAWVSFYDGATATAPGRFVLNVMAEINIEGQMTYETVLEVHMEFDDDPDYYYLAFDKVQIGNLPLPKSIFTTIIGVAEDQGNMDIQGEIDASVPIGDFDLDSISYTIQKDEILAEVAAQAEGSSDEAQVLLMQELLSIIFSNQLLTFDLQDEEFVLTAAVSQFRNDDDPNFPEYLYDLHDPLLDENDVPVVDELGEEVPGAYNPDLFDPEAYLQDVFTDFIFNSALVGEKLSVTEGTETVDYNKFVIEEEIFNKLIYSAAGGFEEIRGSQTIQVSETETKEIELGLKGIWFEFEPDRIYVNALFKIAGIDSMLVITAQEVSEATANNELKFEFVDITFGKDADEADGQYIDITNLDPFKAVFTTLGDVEFGEFNADGDLVITTEKLSALLQDGSADGAIEVGAIALEQDGLVLGVKAPGELGETLEQFQEALQTVIEDNAIVEDLTAELTSDDPEEQADIDAVVDSVSDLQEALADPAEEVTAEQVEELMENFEELEPETQSQFLEVIGDSIEETNPELYAEFLAQFGDFEQTEDAEE